MEGIIVEIADHPVTGHKRKVEIIGLGISWPNEIIGLETRCTYYENVGGDYGDPVSIPMPIQINRALVARTSGGKVVYVDSRSGAVVLKVTLNVDGVPEDHYILEADGVAEIPAEFAQTLFHYLENILRNDPTIVGQMLTQFVISEVAYGTYDAVGR